MLLGSLLTMFLSLVIRFSFLLLRGLTLVQSSKSRHPSPLFQKLSRRPKLPQLACIKNSHHVEVVQSRLELVDNGYHCAVLKPLAQDTLDELVGVRVHAGDHNNNGRGAQDSPRNAKELLLTMRKVQLLDGHFKPTLFGYNVPQLNSSQRIFNGSIRELLSRVGVKSHAASIDEECILRHADQPGANLLTGKRADVELVHSYATTMKVYHAEETRDHGTLTTVEVYS
ncbi:hypothetical protein FJTKL_02089 [Diaporthe vaccinii]|uniref:Uncharacterized protein n=1 Tax=Diaporthe vaccinii TaxID=105482 RepID=A0ABR4DZ48_9PEZI